VKLVAAAAAAVVLVAVGACARESDLDLTEPVTPEPGTLTGSALDAVESDHAATFEGPRRELAALVVSPAALLDEMRLALLQVDDPNGTGRVDGRWYEPRLRTQDCAINVDTPPVPSASAAFVPGDPTEKLGDDTFAATQALIEAPRSVNIQILMFDEASQRDGLADVMIEFYRSMDDLECEAFPSGGGELTDLLLGDMEEVSPYDTGFPSFAFESEGLRGRSLVSQYAVGDRVLLTVSVTTGGLGSADPDDPDADAPDVPEPDPGLAHLAIQAQIDKLEAAGFT
jgi:hypothetical protein